VRLGSGARRFGLATVLGALVIWTAADSAAEAARVKVYLEKGLLTLTSVDAGGGEYLSLANVARASGASLERLTARRYRLRLPTASMTVTEGVPDVRLGSRVVSLSESPRRIGGVMMAPLELLPIALGERYGEARVVWDPRAHVARVASTPYSVRLLRFRTYADRTRVVLQGTRRHDFVLADDGSGRVVLSIIGGVLDPSIGPSHVGDGLLASIEPRQAGRDSEILLRVTDQMASSKAFALKDPDRIVVDLLSRSPSASRASDVAAKTAPTGARPASRQPQHGVSSRAEPAPPPRDTVKTIVIDPGHGGRDPGAIGPSGVKEKDVVLDIGLRLRQMIEEELGLRAVMTRSSDVFLPLEERAAIANRQKADFFISLHVNAEPRSRAVGPETYFLSREPSDRGARASAIRENTVLNLEGIGLGEQESLKGILWDMAQTFYVKESSELAELLLIELRQMLKASDRGIKSAPFFVLIGAAMPSVLVEAAFISNPQEERRLRTAVYRQQVAEALLAGVEKFKSRYEKRVGMVPASAPH
jgi:N-acetylmuramoyl-L-alanine amidase